MSDHDTDGASDGDAEPAAAATRRRALLKGLAAAPAMGALSGCSLSEGGDDPIVADLDRGDTTGFPGAMRFAEAYAMTVRRERDDTAIVTGRFRGGDRVLELTDGRAQGGTTTYLVDGTGYVVTDERCVEYSNLGAGVESVASIDPEAAPDDQRDPDLVVTDLTTVDGQEVLVLERAAADLAAHEPSPTYYVDATTRYPLRIETPTVTVKYDSWGAVDPLEPPDRDCQPAGDG
jgi:hypothetical protein